MAYLTLKYLEGQLVSRQDWLLDKEIDWGKTRGRVEKIKECFKEIMGDNKFEKGTLEIKIKYRD